MKKSEYISSISKKTGKTKKDTIMVLEAMLEVLQECLEKKDRINFLGFGSFSTIDRAARTARIPSTGEKIEVPAKTVVKFKTGSNLKKLVNN